MVKLRRWARGEGWDVEKQAEASARRKSNRTEGRNRAWRRMTASVRPSAAAPSLFTLHSSLFTLHSVHNDAPILNLIERFAYDMQGFHRSYYRVHAALYRRNAALHLQLYPTCSVPINM
jgi:hypothetical protein